MNTHVATLTDSEYKLIQKKRQIAAQKAPTQAKCTEQYKELERLKNSNKQLEQQKMRQMNCTELYNSLTKQIAAEKRKQKRLQNMP